MGEQVDPCDLLDLLEGGIQANPPVMPALEQKTRTGPNVATARSTSAPMASRAGHVTGYGQTIDALRHLLCPWTVTIGHDDVGSLGGEAFGQGPADAVAAAGDDDALSPRSSVAVAVCHAVPPFPRYRAHGERDASASFGQDGT